MLLGVLKLLAAGASAEKLASDVLARLRKGSIQRYHLKLQLVWLLRLILLSTLGLAVLRPSCA